MDQKIINLFDEYTHKPLKREVFLAKLSKLAGGTAAALAILPLLEGNYAMANQVSVQDADLLMEDVSYPSKNCTMKGYLVQPKLSKGKLGAVLVIHENRGLTPHIKDVTRRIAKAGYIALGIDALSPFGGTPVNEDEGRALFAKLDAVQNLENIKSGLDYLRGLKNSNKKTGVVGFCWGGGMVNSMAVMDPELTAAVAYYGRQAEVADVPKIKAKLMLQYAGLDERINAGIPAFEEALKANKKDYQIFVYEGAQHAFNNDSSPARYNAEVAKLAWTRTMGLFDQTLK
ncbi:dienelactone hydrolase family protein [Aquirufa nivalisilvae]|jgi:carboxymethylenebutenolidase|uniref:Carboxymethylenebutenolidase n=1 Tax=Aquirufa nivalisilvae TaxID=2516557 RepID=A0A2S2DXJ0_9BACT|nr:dienelactone hydrolase family protein [Aquirufa nivalisilvae]AWL10118.1 Carboxymethylenebutenolidase [Aquirufa nivalisilvae]MCZ2480745.1 dienelactone hydrolase family protein [Aquirufa nivalisilvae]MCZ2482983.1 dienelactone hydrolase family protein [Aquirufa nivalisilvae]